MQFSVIIPTLNESASLPFALKQLLSSIEYLSRVEILVCDGGSNDDTLKQARQFPIIPLVSETGRAMQMNTGAGRALGDWLVFLHADTRLPDNWMSLIAQSDAPWGRFDLRLSGKQGLLRLIEKAINLRSRKTSIATGDQVLFFRRDFFHSLGGFPEIPLMEDVAISKLARQQHQPACIHEPVITSSRRWEQNGILRTVLLMWSLRLAYWLGVNPGTLHRWYYR